MLFHIPAGTFLRTLQGQQYQMMKLQPEHCDATACTSETFDEAYPKGEGASERHHAIFTVAITIAMLCVVIIGISVSVRLAKERVGSTVTTARHEAKNPDVTAHPDVSPSTPINVTLDQDNGTGQPPANSSLGPETLLCTYGSLTSSEAVLTSDGLCDYAFYDSLYKDNRNNLTGGTGFERDLNTFMLAENLYTRTTLGVAFAFDNLLELERDLEESQTPLLELFWDRNIYHFGILDTPVDAVTSDMSRAIASLKALHDSAENQRKEGHHSISVLAGPSPHTRWSSLFAQQFRRIGYTPDLFIVRGFYPFGDNRVENCAVMPPTLLSKIPMPVNITGDYSYDLADAASSLRELHTNGVMDTGLLLSITMKGRWSAPLPGQPLDFFSRCEQDLISDTFGRYELACGHPRYSTHRVYRPDHHAMLTHHIHKRLLFAYDNERGLCDKLCMVKGTALDTQFGVAAYDVDYDDYANKCSSVNKFGPHSRLKALRRIVDYYKTMAAGRTFDKLTCSCLVP